MLRIFIEMGIVLELGTYGVAQRQRTMDEHNELGALGVASKSTNSQLK